jgi:hypothetical protein
MKPKNTHAGHNQRRRLRQQHRHFLARQKPINDSAIKPRSDFVEILREQVEAQKQS